VFWFLALLALIGGSNPALRGAEQRVRRFTRPAEFEFVGWTLDALWWKFSQYSLGAQAHMAPEGQAALVESYFALLAEHQAIERELREAVADPDGPAPEARRQTLKDRLGESRVEIDRLQPYVESILQSQVAAALAKLKLGYGGRIFPPVAFKFTELPLALVVSPREVVRREADVQLEPGLTLEERIQLEEQVAQGLDVSALVVDIGGIGSYPTMVLESTATRWVIETIAHEWVHNYLTLRPLGMNYETSPELRTMNETAASLVGEAVGRAVLARHYPEMLPAEPRSETTESSEAEPEPPAFDFRAEMHETRLEVDRLLMQGMVEEAERYMEARREVFWEHGYRIRKLNQAYFAFHGAYADQPGGAAGDDPVGAAVRALWAKAESPAAFLRQMAWMNEFSDLERVLNRFETIP
jgi:hypothetical protein